MCQVVHVFLFILHNKIVILQKVSAYNNKSEECMEWSEIINTLGLDIEIDNVPKVFVAIGYGAKISGFKRVLEYDSEHVKLRLSKGNIIVRGDGLEIKILGGKEIYILGCVLQVEYENNTKNKKENKA